MIARAKLVCLMALFAATAVQAGGIYSCTVNGKKITTDREIAGCTGDQWLLNPDGSKVQIVPPARSDEEQSAADIKQRELEAKISEQKATDRKNAILLARFPSEQSHDRARKEALDTMMLSLKHAQEHLIELMNLRQPLLVEKEFYPKRMPDSLREKLELNQVLIEQQKVIIANQQADLNRIQLQYDQELQKLRVLWSKA